MRGTRSLLNSGQARWTGPWVAARELHPVVISPYSRFPGKASPEESTNFRAKPQCARSPRSRALRAANRGLPLKFTPVMLFRHLRIHARGLDPQVLARFRRARSWNDVALGLGGLPGG